METAELENSSGNNFWAILKNKFSRPKWQLFIFCLLHVLIFMYIFHSVIFAALDPHGWGFLPFWNYSANITHGLLPYRDFAVEYPPLGIASITLPGVFADNYYLYYVLFVTEMLLFDLAAMFLITGIVKQLKASLWQSLSVYTIALLAVGRLISIRYDLFPAGLVLLAIYLLLKGKYQFAWGVLAAGTLTKIFPVFIVPVFIVYHLRSNTKRELFTGLAWFAVVCALIVIPALLLSPGGLWNSFTYQTGRGLQMESTWASALLFLKTLNLTSFQYSYLYGAWQIVSPAADVLTAVSTVVMVASLLAVYWRFYRQPRGSELRKQKFEPLNPYDAALIIKYSFLAILVFIITNKVLSPQYVIWLLPLLPLFTGRWRAMSWVLFIVIGVCTYFIYPVFYNQLLAGDELPVILLFMRNLLLVVLAMLAGSDYLQPNLDKQTNLPG
jgi:uncharacterized membrane protein